MADVVDLRGRQPVNHADEFNAELVTDLARFAEGLVTEKDIKRRYRFDAAVWEELGSNDALIAAVEDAKTQRVRSGALKRERAQAEIIDGPPLLGKIMRDPASNPRHIIDAAKAIDALAVGGTEAGAAGQSDRFVITINLSADDGSAPKILHFDKPIAIDTDPLNNTNTTLEESAFAATKPYKPEDDGRW